MLVLSLVMSLLVPTVLANTIVGEQDEVLTTSAVVNESLLTATASSYTIPVYLSGTGSDENSGMTPDAPVLTFEKAKQLVNSTGSGAYILITDTITISSSEQWSFNGITFESAVRRDTTCPIDKPMISITSNGFLEIDNISISGNECAANTAGIVMDGGRLKLGSGGYLTNFSGGSEGGAVYANNEAKVEIGENAAIVDSMAVYGGAIFAATSSEITVKGLISSNGATFGGGIYITGGKLTIDETAVIDGNEAESYAGIYAGTGNTFTLNGGTISNNSTKASHNEAGGVYVGTNASFTMNGGSITGNSSGDGGGIYARGNVTINGDSFITNNTSNNHGGGIYICNGSVATLESCEVSNNTTLNNGGAIYAENATVTIKDSLMSKNKSIAGYGGGIGALGSTITLDAGTEVSENSASLGGALYVANNSTVNLNSAKLIASTVIGEGTDAYIINSVINLGSGTIGGGTSDQFDASALYCAGTSVINYGNGDVEIDGTIFYSVDTTATLGNASTSNNVYNIIAEFPTNGKVIARPDGSASTDATPYISLFLLVSDEGGNLSLAAGGTGNKSIVISGEVTADNPLILSTSGNTLCKVGESVTMRLVLNTNPREFSDVLVTKSSPTGSGMIGTSRYAVNMITSGLYAIDVVLPINSLDDAGSYSISATNGDVTLSTETPITIFTYSLSNSVINIKASADEVNTNKATMTVMNPLLAATLSYGKPVITSDDISVFNPNIVNTQVVADNYNTYTSAQTMTQIGASLGGNGLETAGTIKLASGKNEVELIVNNANAITATLGGTFTIPSISVGGSNGIDATYNMEITASKLDASVPLWISMYGFGMDGTVMTPTSEAFKVTNNSAFPIRVSTIRVNGTNDWSVVETPISEKEISVVVNNANPAEGCIWLDTQIGAKDSLGLSMTSKIAAQKNADLLNSKVLILGFELDIA